MEHFSFHTGERKNGQVNHHDDELAEQQGSSRFLGGQKHFMKAFLARECSPRFGLCMGQAAHTVFNNDHGTVNDDAEIQCAQAHQVGTNPVIDHAKKREQHGQWNYHRRDDGRANIAQKKKQDCNYQNGAFNQVFFHGVDGFVHQHRAVVNGLRNYPFRQVPVYFFQFF